MRRNVLFSLLSIIFTVTTIFAQSNMDKKVNQLFKHLDEIESSYISKIDFQQRRKAIEKVNNMVAILEDLRKSKPPVVKEKTEYLQGNQISDSDFRIFMELLRGIKNRQERLKWVRLFGRSSYFTVNQLVQVMKLYTTDDERIDVVEAILGNVTDFARSQELKNHIRTKKRELDRILKHHELRKK